MFIVWIWPGFRPGLDPGLCVVGFLPLSCKRWDFRPFGLGARCSFISFMPTAPRACYDIWPTNSIPSRAQPLWGSVMKHLRSLPLTLFATKELFCARGLRWATSEQLSLLDPIRRMPILRTEESPKRPTYSSASAALRSLVKIHTLSDDASVKTHHFHQEYLTPIAW